MWRTAGIIRPVKTTGHWNAGDPGSLLRMSHEAHRSMIAAGSTANLLPSPCRCALQCRRPLAVMEQDCHHFAGSDGDRPPPDGDRLRFLDTD
jgi:hypothetical protein